MTEPGFSGARIARHTRNLARVVAFYRDGLGLPELGGFTGHDGYDGVFLDLPGTGAHLEFTVSGHRDVPAAPGPDDLLVLYLPDRAARDALVRRMAHRGHAPVTARNPYWTRHGVTFADPDGWGVVLAIG